MTSRPFVTVVVPVRNEVIHVRACIDAILAQDYPSDRLEILLVDGLSNDGTRDVLFEYASKRPNVQVLNNPAHFVPSAMNVGIKNAKGDIVVRIDSRCIVAPDYVSQCVSYLKKTGAQNVGGPQRAVGHDYVTQVIALAMTSAFGIGNSKFRYSNQEQFVDTVYLGAYPREVFDQIGLYDESLIRNQDYELNYRLRKASGKIFFTPAIRSVYYGRSSLCGLWQQYFGYGFWKVRVLQKHPGSLKARHIVPPLFVLSLVVSALLSVFWFGKLLFGSIVSTYVVASLVASVVAVPRSRWWYMALLPVVFAILHLSWGLGFWWSFLTLGIPPRRVPGSWQ